MSLQLIAKQMEAKGRKGDSMLVHMTPGEVEGLQKLAESMGGSLTINPETGLVEANFLKKVLESKILPTVVGLGVGAATLNPLAGAAAGAAVGGYQAQQNDQDVGLGAFMGGLGGYGGASLGMGLGAAGATAGTTAVAPSAAAGNVAGTAVAPGATTGGIAGSSAATAAPGAAPVTGDAAVAEAVQRQAAEQAAAQTAQLTPSTTTQAFNDGTSIQYFDDGSRLVTDSSGAITAAPGTDVVTAAATPSPYGENLAQAGRGFGQMGTKAGRAEFAKEFGTMEAAASAAPLMSPEKVDEEEIEKDDEMIVYDYTPGRTYAERDAGGSSAEKPYFGENRFTNRRKVKAKDYFNANKGGLLSLAEGGDVAAPASGNSGATADAMSYLMGSAPGAAPSASEAGLAYLMGQTNQSPVVQSALARQNAISNFVAPERAKSTIETTEGYSLIDDGEYKGLYQSESPTFAFDPTAQKFYRKDDVFEYVAPAAEESSDEDNTYGVAQGGLIGLAKGGMASGGFVVPADVVSALGNGSTDAGLRKLNAMMGEIKPIKGKGDGLSDSIKTNIDGKQPARVADGEAYIDPKTVKRLGGAKKLYAMMDKIRAQAHGKTSQQRKVNPAKVMA